MKNVRDLLYIAMMATILVILGFIPAIPLGFIPVPIVLQNLGVMLAGVLLGWKKGSLSILLFYLLGMFLSSFFWEYIFCGFSWSDGWLCGGLVFCTNANQFDFESF